MKYTAHKVFEGKVSVRNYVVERAIEKKEPLEIFVNKRRMVIPPEQLPFCEKTGKVFPARFGSEGSYELWDYPWKPDKTLFEQFV